jgi:hypothetical protein
MYKESLVAATANYQQMRLVVNRLQLSWSALNALVPKNNNVTPEKELIQAALRKRDAHNELTVQLVRDISLARQRRAKAEAACRASQLRNRKMFNQLVSQAAANSGNGPLSLTSPPPVVKPNEAEFLRNFLACLVSGSGVSPDDEDLNDCLFRP